MARRKTRIEPHGKSLVHFGEKIQDIASSTNIEYTTLGE
jgi:hypothetical protein